MAGSKKLRDGEIGTRCRVCGREPHDDGDPEFEGRGPCVHPDAYNDPDNLAAARQQLGLCPGCGGRRQATDAVEHRTVRFVTKAGVLDVEMSVRQFDGTPPAALSASKPRAYGDLSMAEQVSAQLAAMRLVMGAGPGTGADRPERMLDGACPVCGGNLLVELRPARVTIDCGSCGLHVVA